MEGTLDRNYRALPWFAGSRLADGLSCVRNFASKSRFFILPRLVFRPEKETPITH